MMAAIPFSARNLPAILLATLVAASAGGARSQDAGDSATGRASKFSRDEQAQEVLLAAIEAVGGSEAIGSRETIYIKRKITNYDFPEPVEGTITVWFKRPLKIRQEVSYPNRTSIRVFDGERGWVDDGDGPKMLAPHMVLMFKRGIRELDSPLLYMEGDLRYLSVAKDPRGRMTQKISWRHEGYARDLMVDASTNQILVIGEYDTPFGAVSKMKVYDDYRAVQGIMVPFHIEIYRNDVKSTETDILEVRFNEPIDDSLFQSSATGTALRSP